MRNQRYLPRQLILTPLDPSVQLSPQPWPRLFLGPVYDLPSASAFLYGTSWGFPAVLPARFLAPWLL